MRRGIPQGWARAIWKSLFAASDSKRFSAASPRLRIWSKLLMCEADTGLAILRIASTSSVPRIAAISRLPAASTGVTRTPRRGKDSTSFSASSLRKASRTVPWLTPNSKAKRSWRSRPPDLIPPTRIRPARHPLHGLPTRRCRTEQLFSALSIIGPVLECFHIRIAIHGWNAVGDGQSLSIRWGRP